MAHTPIIHGSFTNDMPDKCKQCANCVRNTDLKKLECSLHPEGKFIPKLAFSCYCYRKN